MGVKVLNFEKLDENQQLNQLVRNAVESVFNAIDENFETYSKRIDEVECRSRDGFISSNDGGWSAHSFIDLGSVVHERGFPKLNEAIQTKLNSIHEQGLKDALEDFISHHKDELKALKVPKKKINYRDLCDLNRGDLAEDLSETERLYTSDENSSVMFQLEAFINRRDSRDETRSIHIACTVNWEAPYHRRGKNNEFFAQEDIEFESAEDLKAKLIPALKKIVKKIISQ